MRYIDITSSDNLTMCNLFNDYFQSVFVSSDGTELEITPISDVCNSIINLHSIELSQAIAMRYLKTLDTHKGARPDGIHPLFIKRYKKPITII